MWILILIMILLLSASVCLADSSDLLLSENGKPLAAIVVAADAISAEQTAAKELAEHLNLVTGAEFRIVSTDDEASEDIRIHIGQTESVKSLTPDFDFSKLGKDGIVIRQVGSDLILAGDRPRGTLYAVHTFLEDNVGCRWWAADASHIPKEPSLRVRVNDVVYAPSLRYRETFYHRVLFGQNPEFVVKLKLNGHYQQVPSDWGGHYWIVGGGHSFYPLIPPDKYFADHPEWFSEIRGRRMRDRGQLCLTNMEMRKELTKNVLEWIRERPDAGIVDISQNDWYGACECADCRAVVEREGAESGVLIEFINDVAEEIEKHYPDFLVQTFAYQYTRKPPAHIKPRHNVLVRLCSIEADFAKPLNARTNLEFFSDLRGWKAISQQLTVWDYTVGFGNLMMPNPNFRVLGPNIRLFSRSNVVGLFEQGDGYNSDANFAVMKTWLLARLMWNPDSDENKLMNEFLNGYYGPAGKYMRQYIDLICDAAEDANLILTWNGVDFDYLSPEVLNKAMELFDSAERSVAGDEVLSKRVSVQRAAVDLAVLLSPADPSLPSSKELERTCERFLTVSIESGNTYRQETVSMSPEYHEQLRAKASGRLSVVVADMLRADTMPGYSDAETFAEMNRKMVEVFDFPKDGWKFQRDRSNSGSTAGWSSPDFDDSSWQELSIGKFWEEQIGPYDGYGWYRIGFPAPAIEPGKRVFLAVGAADESAKVWLNGVYVGEGDVGWDRSFKLEVTKALRPDQNNHIAIRVLDTTGYGGLWKSIKLMVR